MSDSPPTPEALSTWSDDELLDEWRKSTEEPGDPLADALAAELQRRDLDF